MRYIAPVIRLMMVLAVAMLWAGCPKKPKYPTCGSDKDCQDGEVCVDKRCVQCATDDQCEAGKMCKDGACIAKEGYCQSNDDCDGVCKENKCAECQSDAECGPDQRCSNGSCLARGACNVDEDCADDEDCVDGKCQRPGRTGGPGVDCSFTPVYFGFDQYTVGDDSKQAVDENYECMQKAPTNAVIISGYTDPRGTEEYNIALSEKRAAGVADYLSRLGVDPALLHILPKGEGMATGTDEATWANDRRVEFEWK